MKCTMSLIRVVLLIQYSNNKTNSRKVKLILDLEASGTPVDKLDGPLGLDGGNSRVNVLGHNVTAVQHATGHVLSMPGIAFDHLIARLKAGIGNLADG